MSLNERALAIVQRIEELASDLRISVTKLGAGSTVLDLGVRVPGSYEAGRLLVEACLAGHGKVSIGDVELDRMRFKSLQVDVESPALACLGSQMAGWKIEVGAYCALGSGPARALARKPHSIYDELGYEERSETAILVLEAESLPSDDVAEHVASACGISPRDLYLLVAPTSSIAGSIQIAGRSVEAVLHKLHRLKFDLSAVLRGRGISPIAPVVSEKWTMMGLVNDFLLGAGQVELEVDVGGRNLSELIRRVPASSSPAYGRPFLEILREARFDFYKVDPDLFSVAKVVMVDAHSKRRYEAGKVDAKLLDSSLRLARTLPEAE